MSHEAFSDFFQLHVDIVHNKMMHESMISNSQKVPPRRSCMHATYIITGAILRTELLLRYHISEKEHNDRYQVCLANNEYRSRFSKIIDKIINFQISTPSYIAVSKLNAYYFAIFACFFYLRFPASFVSYDMNISSRIIQLFLTINRTLELRGKSEWLHKDI